MVVNGCSKKKVKTVANKTTLKAEKVSGKINKRVE